MSVEDVVEDILEGVSERLPAKCDPLLLGDKVADGDERVEFG